METILNERYQLMEQLGLGGIGVVYRAQDIILGRQIAVKLLSQKDIDNEGRERLLLEAQMAAKLNHPNIVTVFDASEADLTGFQNHSGIVPFIVMEYIEGENLFDRPPETIEDIVRVMQQLCAALEHAHGNGIIHRDLKPENVLITPDGTAKLMDFGLARSVASRLTSEGMIVGTVFYLAPEQALGQNIDQRADLYSLGVMLYELTTGELPFKADDPVAVISQHLHAPLIPPRAKNTQIPPGLESLIIDLLRKDPSDRPACAAEVNQSLSKPEILDSDDSIAVERTLLDRIVRGQIVGRRDELQRARDYWNKVQSSEGQTLLISGEPGVGKTRLMREIVAQAEVSGGQALVGSCFPEGNGPFEAFRQIIRQAFRRNPRLQDDFPEFVLAELLTLAPNLKALYPDVPDNPPLDIQAQQQRLLESVVTFCRALSSRSPLLLVVDDLHWADGGTLSLFRHLARRTRRQRIMLLGTYREVELDLTLPFNQVLSDLNRERLATRLKLLRLNREQTCEMLITLFAEEITPDFLDGIFYETEGNPFFIEEVCKTLLESGALHFDGERWHRPDVEELEIPQSVRLAIQARVGKLSDRVQDTLTLAAVFGREFDFDVMTAASGLDEDSLIETLESAEHAQLIEEISSERGGTFTFSHTLIPATLISSLSGLKKRRLHRKIAVVLENLRPDDYDSLASQYTQAEVEDRALSYLTKAGDQARQAYANQDAVRYYTQALEILPEESTRSRFELLESRFAAYEAMAEREAQLADAQAMLDLAEVMNDDVLRCKALLSLTEYNRVAEYARAFNLASQALEIARSLSDPILEAWALLQIGDTNILMGRYPSLEVLVRAADLFQQESLTAEAARCLHTLSFAHYKLGDYSASFQAAERALALSRAAGDKRQEAISLRRLGLSYMVTKNFEKAIPYSEKALVIGSQIGDRDGEMDALNNLGVQYSSLGRYEDGKRYLQASIQIAEEIGSQTVSVYAYYWYIIVPSGEYEAGLKFMQKRYENARKDGNDSLAVSCHKIIRNIFNDLGQYAKRQALLGPEIITLTEKVFGKANLMDLKTELGLDRVLMGDVHEGLHILEDVCQQLASLHATDIYGLAWLSLAIAKTFANEPSVWLTGLDDIENAFPYFSAEAAFMEKPFSLCIKAQLYRKLGQIEEALSSSAEGVEWMEEKRIHLWQEYCLITHVQILRAVGRDEEADSYLQKAYERLMLVSGKTKDDNLRKSYLENVPWNRKILEEAKVLGLYA